MRFRLIGRKTYRHPTPTSKKSEMAVRVPFKGSSGSGARAIQFNTERKAWEAMLASILKGESRSAASARYSSAVISVGKTRLEKRQR